MPRKADFIYAIDKKSWAVKWIRRETALRNPGAAFHVTGQMLIRVCSVFLFMIVLVHDLVCCWVPNSTFNLYDLVACDYMVIPGEGMIGTFEHF